MTGGLRYLSDRWLAEADRHLGGLTPIAAEVAVGIVVRGGPGQETGAGSGSDPVRHYRLILGPDRVGIEPGAETAGVRMTLDWDVAVAIAQGRASAQRAFLDGNLQLGGDTSLLLGHQQQLADIDDRLSELRSRTVYS